MNELKRYDQALADKLEYLSMPPEDFAWAEMKKLLEEDDNDPVVVPFFRRPGCLLLGLVTALLLSIGGWFYFKRNAVPAPVSEQVSSGNGKKDTTADNIDSKDSNSTLIKTKDTADTIATTAVLVPSDTIQNRVTKKVPPTTITASTDQQTSESTGESRAQKKRINGRSAIRITPSTAGENEGGNKRGTKKKPGYSSPGTKTKATVVSTGTGEDENDTSNKADDITKGKDSVADPGKIKMSIQPGAPDSSTAKITGKDSSIIVKKDSLPNKKTPTPPAPEEDKREKEKYWQAAAGLSVYQPLPLNGEPVVPYNYYGRKGSLTDYIPSVYFRLYRSRKWFAHIEFRYGAPQSVKPFNYKQVIRDSIQQTFRTVYQLKKTYYHQVPFSLNYYVLPGFSLGASVIYNRFTGAIARQEVFRTGLADTLLSSSVIRDAEADKVIRNHFQWGAEAQYQWKRLSVGARYSADINPYIKYNDISTGTSIEKKGKAMNVFLRYDLWRSKKWGK